MKTNIAIIDDDIQFLSNFRNIIEEEFNILNLKDYNIDIYTHYNDLIENIDKYHCVFLDVEMPNINGLELAQLIRNKKKDIYIIFVSSFANYVFQSFNVHPFSYIVKNDLQNQGKNEIKRFLRHYYAERKTFNLKIGNLEYDLKQRNIYLIEKQGNDCWFYYGDKKFKIRCDLKSLLNNLTYYFMLINKSEIINFHYIKDIKKDEIKLNNGSIHYISRRKTKNVVENYYAFLKNEPSNDR